MEYENWNDAVLPVLLLTRESHINVNESAVHRNRRHN